MLRLDGKTLDHRPAASFAIACGLILAAFAGCDNGPTTKDNGKGGSTNTASTTTSDAGPKESSGKTSGDSSAEGKRFVILMNNNSPFWDVIRAGIVAANKDLGLDAKLDTNDGKPEHQIKRLQQYNTESDIAAVGISVTEANNAAIADELKKLRDRGVAVVCIDSDVNRENFRDARFAFVGTDNVVGGQELGKCAKGLLPDGGNYVTFVGLTGAQNARERIGGFGQGAGDKFKLIDSMADHSDPSKAQQNVRDAMTNHPEVNCLVGIWSYNAPAICDVVVERKNRDKYKVVTFDAEPGAIAQMAKGNIDAMVVQNPYEMGYQTVRLLNALVKKDQATIDKMLPNQGKDKEAGDLYDTGLKIVVPDDATTLKPEMFAKNSQFLKLSEFRDWLKKYDLKGS
jgi:ribose transport system substrate-binding protein